MRIEKYYGKNAILGDKFNPTKLGLTIKYDKEIKSKAELKKISKQLLKLAEETIEEEVQMLKEGVEDET